MATHQTSPTLPQRQINPPNKSPKDIARPSLIHRYEAPRKAVHVLVSILLCCPYFAGVPSEQITVWTLEALVLFGAIDAVRLRCAPFNAVHQSMFGFLMRPHEISQYNSLVWYLLGCNLVLWIFPVDLSLMGILTLGLCDTAAAMGGRMWGRLTRTLRPGKTLAGSLSAFCTGGITAAIFWGYFLFWAANSRFPSPPAAFMFTGQLRICYPILRAVEDGSPQIWDCVARRCFVISGHWALMVISIVCGLVAAGGECVGVYGLDDNLTVPVLSSLGLWGFLHIFG